MHKRHTGARTLAQVMDESSSLAQLSARLQASEQCLQTVLSLIPAPMRKAVRSGPLEPINEQPLTTPEYYWVLLAENPSVAAKLRQLSPLMLQKLGKANISVQEVRVQIISHQY